MYGIFTYIYHKDQPNVGKYTSHMDPIWVIMQKLLPCVSLHPIHITIFVTRFVYKNVGAEVLAVLWFEIKNCYGIVVNCLGFTKVARFGGPLSLYQVIGAMTLEPIGMGNAIYFLWRFEFYCMMYECFFVVCKM